MSQFQFGVSTYRPGLTTNFDAVWTIYDNVDALEELEKVFNTWVAFEAILLDLCRLMIHDHNYREE